MRCLLVCCSAFASCFAFSLAGASEIVWRESDLLGGRLELEDSERVAVYRFFADGMVVAQVGRVDGFLAGPVLEWRTDGGRVLSILDEEGDPLAELTLNSIEGNRYFVEAEGKQWVYVFEREQNRKSQDWMFLRPFYASNLSLKAVFVHDRDLIPLLQGELDIEDLHPVLGSGTSNYIVIQLQNLGNQMAWGELEYRISETQPNPYQLSVPGLSARSKPYTFVIPIHGRHLSSTDASKGPIVYWRRLYAK